MTVPATMRSQCTHALVGLRRFVPFVKLERWWKRYRPLRGEPREQNASPRDVALVTGSRLREATERVTEGALARELVRRHQLVEGIARIGRRRALLRLRAGLVRLGTGLAAASNARSGGSGFAPPVCHNEIFGLCGRGSDAARCQERRRERERARAPRPTSSRDASQR